MTSKLPRFSSLRWVLACSISLVVVAGCATVFTESSNKLTFSSDVADVRIFIDGRLVGKTPLEIKVNKKMGAKGRTIRAEKEGFKTQEFSLQKKFNKAAIWNSTSIFSWGTDLLTGALFEYEPTKYHIELVPDKRTAIAPKFIRNRLIHRFVVVNYSGILEELSRGHGAYLTSLVSVWIEDNSERGMFLDLLGHNRDLLLLSQSGPDLLISINSVLASNANMKRYLL